MLIKAAAGNADGVCTPDDVCLTPKAATEFLALSELVGKCSLCKPGYFVLIATAGDAFGTCTAGTKCSTGNVATYLTADAFEQDCAICASGFYQIAKVASTANCAPLPSDSNCLLADNSVIADDATAKTKCTKCTDGYFP